MNLQGYYNLFIENFDSIAAAILFFSILIYYIFFRRKISIKNHFTSCTIFSFIALLFCGFEILNPQYLSCFLVMIIMAGDDLMENK